MIRYKNVVKEEKGFTLIELLLVVAILGVIAALAIPRIGESLKDSRVNGCKRNVTVMKEQLELYKQKGTQYPTDQTDFGNFLSNKLWFTDVPKCPKGAAYSYTRIAGPPEDYTVTCPDTTENHN